MMWKELSLLIVLFLILVINLFLRKNHNFSILSELISFKLYLVFFFTFYFFPGGEFYFLFIISLNLSFLVLLIFYWVFKVK